MTPAPVDETLLARQTRRDDLAERVLAGASLRIFLEPDETVASRHGTEDYIETLELPFATIRDSRVWASQARNVVDGQDGRLRRSFYSYCNRFDLFCWSGYVATEDTLRGGSMQALLMSTGRYKRLRWIVLDDFELCYDSATGGDGRALRDRIEDGRAFKAAIQDPAGWWIVAPVTYPFWYHQTDRFEFHTHLQLLPDLFIHREEDLVPQLLQAVPGMFRHDDPDGREQNIALNVGPIPTYFSIGPDNRIQRLQEKASGGTYAPHRVRIFCSRQ